MSSTRHKIVLVDDNMATLNQGKTLLQDMYRVYTVQSPATLFENLEHDIPDLILLDVEMPEMNGFEVIKKLKADNRYRDIPVMFLTAKSDEASEREGFRLGAVDYIAKPFSGPLLHKRISNQILFKRVQSAVEDYSNNLEEMMDEVARANERAKILLDKTPLCARLWDTNMDLIDCNEAALELFGFKDKDECKKRYSELYPEFQSDGQRSVEKVKKYIDKAFEEGKCAFDWTYKMLDGTLMPAEVILVRVEYGGSYAVAGYTRDLREQIALIEEMRRAEIAEESNKAKTRFLANMSHEMRTPLNVVLGLTDLMLEEEKPGPNLKENLMKISTAGNTLLALINHILNISKEESGKPKLENLDKISFSDEKQAIEKKQPIEKKQLIRPDLSYAKVLVVDDMKANLDVAKALLGKYKMQIDCVLSGKEAVEKINSGQQVYNAIFMDHMMPEMDGIETAKAIRALGTEYARKIPIIALTANAVAGTEEMFYANDFQDFISKPINIIKLDSVIQKWVQNKKI